MIIVHFEVYVLEGRGWMLHARFPRLERDEAIREAKELESTLGVRVKVLRETYNTDSNAFDETEVYVSGHNPQPAKKSAPIGGGGGGGSNRSAGAARPGTGKAKAVSARAANTKTTVNTAALTGIVLRLTVVLLIAVGVSLGALRLVPSVVTYLYDYGFRITPDDYGQLLFSVFTLVFLMTSVPLALRFLPRDANLTVRKANSRAPARQKPVADRNVKKSLDKLARKAEAEIIPDKWSDDELEDDAIASVDVEDGLPEILPGPDETPPEIGGRFEEEPSAAETALESLPSTPALDDCSAVASRFLDQAIATVRQVTPVIDKYNSFALNLYMAGAIQTLADARRLDGGGQRKLLKAALEKLGSSGDVAAHFYDKVPEYQREARYAKMVETGRSAMGSWIEGDETTPHMKVQAAIKDWNRPTAEKKPSIMTVMFTDMVGSTDLTQARGDVAAQEIVRKHNAIVRTALTQFAGHEVKHTGDGIMASFASAANAIEATIQIQRQVATHNEKQPNLPLHLRIGLNSGEPIQEEDDLFGSTVQLAARVCAATQSDQTLCTQVVRDLAGARGGFDNAGMHTLKGFRDKFQLWEVTWR